MLCDDIDATRTELEARGVEFLTTEIADVAGLRTTWCHDPWGTVIILMEKSEDALPTGGSGCADGAQTPLRRPLQAVTALGSDAFRQLFEQV